MSKLDWSKTKYNTADPGRVTNVGDYGILSDSRAGRQGDPVRKAIKLAKSSPKKPQKTDKQKKKEAAQTAKIKQQVKRKAMKAVSPGPQSHEVIAEKLNKRMVGVEVYVRKSKGNIVRVNKDGLR